MVPIGLTAPINGLMLTELAPDIFHCNTETPPVFIMAGFAVKELIAGPLAPPAAGEAPVLDPPGLVDAPEAGLTVTFTVTLVLLVPSLAVSV